MPPSEIWESAAFVRSCYTTTSVWSLVFLINLASSFMAFYSREIPAWQFTVLNYSMLLGGVAYTSIYTKYLHRRRAVKL
jgi:hypothetical protein